MGKTAGTARQDYMAGGYPAGIGMRLLAKFVESACIFVSWEQVSAKMKIEVEHMVTQISSFGLYGMNAFPVTVEVSLSRGTPYFEIVGLPDNAVRESRERIRSALENMGIPMPPSRIIVNLAPADVKKAGTMYDLPILLGILVCMGRIEPQPSERCYIGEVSLTGDTCSVNGVLPMALAAVSAGVTELYVPAGNCAEAAAAQLCVYGVDTILHLISHLEHEIQLERAKNYQFTEEAFPGTLDFADVKGQQNAKYALEIAAAGGHNALMIGSPGSGKSMLAKRLATILPPMTKEEALETTQIYSVAGLLRGSQSFVPRRPFRSPHHTVSGAGLVGGGTIPHPGEISLAHNGVLFLDELAEFDRRTLEIMRQPLEDDKVTITRASGTITYPCRFMLIGAMNPCPCGYFGHPKHKCTCTSRQVHQYLSRISGPLLDRFDLHIDVDPVPFELLASPQKAEPSSEIRRRVMRAREIQEQRLRDAGVFCNAAIPAGQVQQYCPMEDSAKEMLRSVFENLGLSARAYERILKVARTVADLDGSESIRKAHIACAVQFRSLDRKYWKK